LPPIYNRLCEQPNILPTWFRSAPTDHVIAELLPLIVGATAVPFYPIVVLLMLQGQGGLLKAIAFGAGNIAVRLAQGVLFGLVFDVAMAASSEDAQRLGVSTLLLIIGILLLITAVKKWQKEEDPDAPPPQWMSAIGGLSAVKALGAGALLVTVAAKQWVFTLSAIGVISEAELGEAASTGLYLIYVLATQTLVVLPIVGYAVASHQAAGLLKAAETWLERHNRVIVITVALILGCGSYTRASQD
jgi:Sap, sulfolipid-1-addressing protein